MIGLVPAQRFFVIDDGGTSLINIYTFFLFGNLILYKSINRGYFILSCGLLLTSILIANLQENVIVFLVCLKLVVVTNLIYNGFVLESRDFQIKIVTSFILGSFCFVVFSYFFINDGGTSSRFSAGPLNDPNYVGLICMLAITVLFILRKNGEISIPTFVILVIVFIFFGLMTQSRSFIALFALFVFLECMISIKNRPKLTISVVFPFFVYLGYLIYLRIDDIVLLNNVSSRVTNPTSGDLSNGRFELWTMYLNYLFTDFNLLYGLGSNAFERLNIGQVAHNFFIEDLVLLGLPLTMFCYLFLFIFYSKIIGTSRFDFYSYSPIFVILGSSLTLHSFLGTSGILLLYVGFVVIAYNSSSDCQTKLL
jgi:hypothetical protein